MRLPRIPPLAELVPRNVTLDYQEAAALARLRLDFANMNLSGEEARELFRTAIVPVLVGKQYAPGGEFHELRPAILREVTRQLVTPASTATQKGRGPASTPAEPDSTAAKK